MEDKLELRMYGIVPYNISAIQQAIQFAHAVVEYGQMVKSENPDVEGLEANGQRYMHINNLMAPTISSLYNDWADNWKTFIILNGGTSNHSINRYHEGDFVGTMEQHLEKLNEIGIVNATFNEPDLNDMLSAVVFIVDERVFNRKKYLDLGDWIWVNRGEYLTDRMITTQRIDKMYRNGYFQTDANKEERLLYSDWVESIGGEKNVRLRDFLKNLKLA
jgi:hypothetical protein